jgi:Ca2+-binding EF-hand superfamily protein
MKKYSLPALILGSGVLLAGTALAGGPDCGKGGKGGAGRFNQLDTNKDGKVTLAELTQSKEGWFSQIDANKDGVATPAEVEASHKARRTQHIERMFQRKDVNRDGRLTREESGKPEPWFAKADVNRDGALTQAELAQAPARGQRDPAAKHARGAGRGAHMDQNGDGKVDRDEVRKAAAQKFERMDRNSDGSLTAEELGAHQGKSHGKGGHHPKGTTEDKAQPPHPKAS